MKLQELCNFEEQLKEKKREVMSVGKELIKLQGIADK